MGIQNMQSTCRICISLCIGIFCIYMHSPLCWCHRLYFMTYEFRYKFMYMQNIMISYMNSGSGPPARVRGSRFQMLALWLRLAVRVSGTSSQSRWPPGVAVAAGRPQPRRRTTGRAPATSAWVEWSWKSQPAAGWLEARPGCSSGQQRSS